MILDLTSPLSEKCSYKNPSQTKAWGYFCYSRILRYYCQESSWRTFFLRGKMKIDSKHQIEIGKPYLRISKLHACWNELGGVQIETKNGSGSWLGGTW